MPGNTHPLFPAHFFALSSCSLTLCCPACERHASKSRETKCCNKRAVDRQPFRKLRFLRESIGGGSKGDIYGTGAEAGKYKVFSEWRRPSFSTVRNRHGRSSIFVPTDEIESNSADSLEIALKRCSKFSGISRHSEDLYGKYVYFFILFFFEVFAICKTKHDRYVA